MSDRVTHQEAQEILHRFNNSHWHNSGERARYSIPADPSRDDDIRLANYIEQNEEIEKQRDRAVELLYMLDRTESRHPDVAEFLDGMEKERGDE